MPRGDGTGPIGRGPLSQGRCSRLVKSSNQGLSNSSSNGSTYSNTFLNSADDLETRARQLEKQAGDLRSKAKKLRDVSTEG